MLFLGAGASKAMGIDDLADITQKVKKSVSSDLRNTIEQLEDLFNENNKILGNFKVDVEVLLTIFNCLCNRGHMLNE